MNRNRYLAHGAIILGGLVLGLLLRGGVKSERQQLSQNGTKSGVARTVGRTGLRGGNHLSTIERILAHGSGSGLKLTPVENALLERSFFQLESADFARTLEALLAKNMESNRFRVLAKSLFLEWGKRDPAQALEALAMVPSEARPSLRGMVYLGWALTDADAAFENAGQSSLAASGSMMEGLSSLWENYARERPELALSRLALLDEEEGSREGLEESVLTSVSSVRPDLALDWVRENREGEELKESLSSLIFGWGRVDYEQAFSYVKDLPVELQSARVFETIGGSFSGGWEEAIEIAEELPKDYRSDFLAGRIESLASFEPMQAIEIGKTLPEGKVKENAYFRLGNSWGGEDPVAAGEWLITLPRSTSRDTAIMAFASRIRNQDYEVAAQWMSDVDDGGRRGRVLPNILQEWLTVDETAARTWMGQQTPDIVPEEMRRQLLNEE